LVKNYLKLILLPIPVHQKAFSWLLSTAVVSLLGMKFMASNSASLWLDALPTYSVDDNKYTRGHAVVFGGFPQTGAARMAARAAARMGAGLTTVAVSAEALPVYAAALESVMVKSISATHNFEQLISDPRVTAFLIGPGAGISESTRNRVLQLLSFGKPTVLDADALTVFSEDPSLLFGAIKGPCVLTPHEGEFGRIFDFVGSREVRAAAASKQSNAVVVLKGPSTVIAAPNNSVIINENAPPTLATAGSGDVLAGMILGLLAQSMDAMLASAAAAWMHGQAAQNFGPGLIAEDLPDCLPEVWRNLRTE
jgi:NAD(P)H-hydrate epimerase